MARTDRLSPYRTTWTRDAFNGRVTYVSTVVVEWHINADSSADVILRSGGYETVTTKRKMNQAARQFGLGYAVYQKDFQWYVSVFHNGRDYLSGSTDYEFYDGMTVNVGTGFPLLPRHGIPGIGKSATI